MLVKLFSSWPEWLNDFLVGNETELGWHRIVDVSVDGFTLARVLDALMIFLWLCMKVGSDRRGLMMLLLMMHLHMDGGVDVGVGIDDDDVEAGTLLLPPNWPGIDGWLLIMALWFG